MDSAFEKYKRNNSFIKFQYHGIKLNSIISYSLWKMGENSKYNGIGKKGCFRTIKISSLKKNKGTDVLAVCETGRKDQLLMNDLALKKINIEIIPNHLCDKEYHVFCFNPSIMLKCFFYVFVILRTFALKQKIKMFFDFVY